MKVDDKMMQNKERKEGKVGGGRKETAREEERRGGRKEGRARGYDRRY